MRTTKHPEGLTGGREVVSEARSHQPIPQSNFWMSSRSHRMSLSIISSAEKSARLLKSFQMTKHTRCTAIGNLDHSLNQDCATIQSQLKGVSDGETKKIYP